jgi:hypothetical protein
MLISLFFHTASIGDIGVYYFSTSGVHILKTSPYIITNLISDGHGVMKFSGFTHPLHLRLLRLCPSFIHHISIAQDLSNSVRSLVNLTLIYSLIDSDHSSYLFSVNTVIHRLCYVQSTAQTIHAATQPSVSYCAKSFYNFTDIRVCF